jgi:nitrite reductase (cytochrome c-552)
MMATPLRSFVLTAAASGLAACVACLVAVNLAPSQGYPINDDTDDPAVWGKIFRAHYESYLRTTDMQRTRHGGSESEPRTPSKADPRSVVAKSKVEEDAGLRAMWQGYAFAIDFREDRGHAYMLEDQTYTKRTQTVAQPGACMNCHASTYVAYKKAGNGDITKGFERINQMPFFDAIKLVKHPVSCIDCHDSQTLALRVTRPAFIEGIRALKASQGVKDYDVNKQATKQEMRAYVCGQCHVEYYFKGAEKRLVFPWAKGLKIEQIQAYYDEIGFRDWTHRDTGAPTLKAQHPEFELWNQGVHARSGVTCSDCHMPRIQQKDATISDHWVRSPMLNVANACLGCHQRKDANVTEKDLKYRVD